MSKEERLQKILRYLDGRDSTTVKELSGVLYASLPTIYRDLRELTRRNLVHHADGYIRKNSEQTVTTPTYHRITAHAAEKARIAEAAACLLRDHMVIYLDSSTTVSFLIEKMQRFSDLTVLTNGLTTAMMLRQAGIETVCVGGALAENSLAGCGRIACDTIAHYRIDGAFFSAYAVSEEGMITDPSEYEAALARQVIRQAGFAVLMCDHSKFGKTSLFRTVSLPDIDYLVTDCPLEQIKSTVKKEILSAP